LNLTLQITKPLPIFWDKIIQNDKELFIKLNALGTEKWDAFWLIITDKDCWLPLFLLLFFLLIKAFGWKKGLIIILFSAILVTFSDQLVNLIKNTVGRLRPNNDPEIKDIIRVLKRPGSYSFVSGHATTSLAITTFMILLLKNNFKLIRLLLIWPLLFAYSRIYCGVHFPIDIVFGMCLGVTIGFVFYRLCLLFLLKVK
jgi:undecaprenyl-diphosphatase